MSHEQFPDTGWFYRGSEEGYGDFDFICDECGKIIHKADLEEEDNADQNLRLKFTAET